MHTSAARNVVKFFRIRTSCLQSRVGYVSKLSSAYLWYRPRWCTTAQSSQCSVYSVACTLATEAWNAQSAVPKSHCQNSNFDSERNCTHSQNHLLNMSWCLSCLCQITVSQVCAPRFAPSVGCKHWLGRIFGDELRPVNNRWQAWSLKWKCTWSYLQNGWGFGVNRSRWMGKIDLVESLESLLR